MAYIGFHRSPRSSTISIQDTTNKKNLLLLIQLRWLAVSGQVVTILFVHYWLGIALPLSLMGAVVLMLVCLNGLSLLWLRRQDAVTNTELFLELSLDVAALTAQVYLSGGASNPFIWLYLLQVVLGAILLDAWSTWLLVMITAAAFIWLSANFRPMIVTDPLLAADLASLRIRGMFICFVLAASLTVLFVARINRNLRARDEHLAALRQRSVEEDHVVRLGLLASGAAHELGTPLATLSVILSDWRHMQVFKSDPELAQEIEEMQGQLDRCKTIVSGILMSSGEARGEGSVHTTVNEFFDELVGEWRTARTPANLAYVNTFSPDETAVSDTALKQVIFNVLDNALEASPGWVSVSIARQSQRVVVTVSDSGPGFEAAILSEFGKPYRSSKGRPGGGLGLFLVVNVVRKLGGAVSARNGVTGGAVVTLTLPLSALSAGDDDDI